MFRDNPLLPRLEGGPPLVGCWSHLVSPMAAEVVALCGYDFVLIDNEHGPASLSESTAIMQAVSGTGVATMMRVPWRSEEHTSELQSRRNPVCRLLLEKKKTTHSRPARRHSQAAH